MKEYASDWVQKHILDELLAAPSFQAYNNLSDTDKQVPTNRRLLESAMRECYASTDKKLLTWFREVQCHYSSCTAVTVLVHHPTSRMYVAHLGDSHCVIAVPCGK